MKYKALRNFSYRKRMTSPLTSVKKGDEVEICNSADFPKLENDFIESKYISKIEAKIDEKTSK